MMSDRRACRRRVHVLAPALAGALMLVMSPAGAEDISRQRPEIPDPGAALDELQRLLDELGRLIERMPRYALPEVTEDGDIIIRRKDAPDADEPPDDGRPAEEGPDGVIDL